MRPVSRTYDYRGEQLGTGALAKLAGVSWTAMYFRLQRHSAEAAVAMGAADRDRRWRNPTPAPAAPAPTPETAPRRKPMESVAARPKAGQVEVKLDPLAEAEIPVFVKLTVIPTPPDRFAVDHVPSMFSSMRPGEYMPSTSAISRAYRDKS